MAAGDPAAPAVTGNTASQANASASPTATERSAVTTVVEAVAGPAKSQKFVSTDYAVRPNVRTRSAEKMASAAIAENARVNKISA